MYSRCFSVFIFYILAKIVRGVKRRDVQCRSNTCRFGSVLFRVAPRRSARLSSNIGHRCTPVVKGTTGVRPRYSVVKGRRPCLCQGLLPSLPLRCLVPRLVADKQHELSAQRHVLDNGFVKDGVDEDGGGGGCDRGGEDLVPLVR